MTEKSEKDIIIKALLMLTTADHYQPEGMLKFSAKMHGLHVDFSSKHEFSRP